MKRFQIFAAMLAAMLLTAAVGQAQEATATAVPIKLKFAEGFQPANGLYQLQGDTLTKVEAPAPKVETAQAFPLRSKAALPTPSKSALTASPTNLKSGPLALPTSSGNACRNGRCPLPTQQYGQASRLGPVSSETNPPSSGNASRPVRRRGWFLLLPQ